MKSKDIKIFFDSHSHYSAYNKNPDYYIPVVKSLSHFANKEFNVLDVGCGDGSFLKGLRNSGVKGRFIGIDISYNLLKKAKDDLRIEDNINLIVTDGFNIPINDALKFDLIHLDSVLHHLISDTRYKSLKLSKDLLRMLKSKLSKNGILLVEEMYYNSRVIPFITSSFIFYSLKLINASNIDFSILRNDIKPGLEVSFFYEDQLKKILNQFGPVEIISRIPSKISNLEKSLLLKERGHISYLVKTT
ncbi:methyltransferase domain-containing protein [soil metagenome]